MKATVISNNCEKYEVHSVSHDVIKGNCWGRHKSVTANKQN
jgi:hypothetical protein